MGALSKMVAWLRTDRPTGVGRKSFTLVTDDGFIPADLATRVGRFGRNPDLLIQSNVVMSPINWILRNFTEAEATVQRRTDRTWEFDEDHPLSRVLAAPNPFYGDGLLWKATILSFLLDGNAYWQKVRNGLGEVIGFWYLPHFLVQPKWPQDGSAFISHYEYTPGQGPSVPLAAANVVHLRAGLDPSNPRLGLSPMKPLLREVYTDEEAAIFSSAILGNMGVPGGIISPKDGDALPNEEDVKQMKARMVNFTGHRRGEWMVLGSPTEVKQFGFDPNNLQLGPLRDIAEERVCAALGVPAAVVGFGSGLQQTKVGATMRELRKEAWDSCIRPMQNDTAKQLSAQVIPDFARQTSRFRVRFDVSAFAASQEEEKEKAARAALLVQSGILRVDRAQAMLGLDVDPSREVYLGPGSTAATESLDEEEDDSAAPPAEETDDEQLAKLANRVTALLTHGNGRHG